jgi:hypothetical protein
MVSTVWTSMLYKEKRKESCSTGGRMSIDQKKRKFRCEDKSQNFEKEKLFPLEEDVIILKEELLD